MSRCRTVVIALAAVVALAIPAAARAAAAQPPPPPPPASSGPEASYLIEGVDTAAERTRVARSGVDVLANRPDRVEVRATGAEAQRLREAGFTLVPLPPAVPAQPLPRVGQFPPGFTGYHTYDEMNAELAALATENPDTVALSDYGASFEGRPLPLVKISDAVAVDEDEPEVLFTCAQHAREHLTVEMCLHIAERLAADPALVADREVWLMPMVNPDGAEFDIATGAFVLWRKNRQPTPGSLMIGTDLNRDWGTQWGCCDGSSPDPSAQDYRGPAPFSAPEITQIRDWVGSRVVDGEQQITAHIDWHTYSELVLWPFGYTPDDTAPGLDAPAAAAFRGLGEAMAATNGYTPQQSSDLYITDGGINDWMWAEHGIWSFTFEMYPTSQLAGGFYPPDAVIDRETTRNDAAVDLLLDYADCVPRITGAAC